MGEGYRGRKAARIGGRYRYQFEPLRAEGDRPGPTSTPAPAVEGKNELAFARPNKVRLIDSGVPPDLELVCDGNKFAGMVRTTGRYPEAESPARIDFQTLVGGPWRSLLLLCPNDRLNAVMIALLVADDPAQELLRAGGGRVAREPSRDLDGRRLVVLRLDGDAVPEW